MWKGYSSDRRSYPGRFQEVRSSAGSKGVGKTTLLRYQKAIHDGVALHLSLATELSSLARQDALGPLVRQASGVRSDFVGNKASALLSLSIASRLLRKRVRVNRDAVAECIPRTLLGRMPRSLRDWLWEAKIRVSRASLPVFESVPMTRPLVEFGREAAEASLRAEGSLLLLLDRADLVSPLALVPVLQLMDQSPGYTALVATRPGHGSGIVTRLDESSAPGDHYDVYNLGRSPLTKEWADFVSDALAAQVGEELLKRIGRDRLDAVIALSRDSIRLALEVIARVAPSREDNIDGNLIEALVDLRELYFMAVKTKLRPHHQDYGEAISWLRKEVIKKVGQVRGPVTLNILPENEPLLIPEPTRLFLFIEAALRSAALCIPNGRIWLPGDCPTLLEVPPLLMWQPGDPRWSYADAERLEPLKIREQDFRRVRGGPSPVPSVFIAYRMHSEESKAFSVALEQELSVHSRLATVKVQNGWVPVGTEDWAEEIRRRIGSSSLVVGDCTGMRPEVVFELGFAYGLGVPLLPVVAAGARSELPYWLRRRQVGEFQSGLDLGDLVASIEAHLADPSLRPRRGNPPPLPALLVWIKPTDWTSQATKQFQTLTQRENIHAEIYSDQDPPAKILERATLASFLVVTLDGTEWDAFAHYVCGAVVARPDAGYGAKKLSRRIVVVEPPDAKEREYTAEGLSRCEDTVVVVKPSSVREEARLFLERFRQWRQQPK